MADVFKVEKRSQIMAAIKGVNTKPEKFIRSLVHRMGFRFRLHRKDLPGKPDMVFPQHRKVIFINGCFWHGHIACNRGKLPKTNQLFWSNKIHSNKVRDVVVKRKLRNMGWESLVLWQCQIKRDPTKLGNKIKKFLLK